MLFVDQRYFVESESDEHCLSKDCLAVNNLTIFIWRSAINLAADEQPKTQHEAVTGINLRQGN